MLVTLNIPDERIISCLQAGQIAYWGDYKDGWDHGAPGNSAIERYENAYKELMTGKRGIMVVELEDSRKGKPEGPREIVMTRATILKALELIAEKWPWHFEAILKDNMDAETGDVLIQVSCFKDIVYG